MAIIIALALICYLIFLIDWRDFRDVLRQGGWAAVVIYAVVAIFIYGALVTPVAVRTMEMSR